MAAGLNPTGECRPGTVDLEVLWRFGFFARRFAADDALGHQRFQAGIQGLHTQRATGLNGRVHLRHLVLADQVTDGRGAYHDFVGRHTTTADLLQQGLRDNRLQRFGEHGANHGFLFGREYVNHAVDGFGRRGGVQSAEYQVTGFRCGQGQADGFQVTHLADQDDIRVFPQRRAQGFGEAAGVAVHLTLVDQALFRLVNELDWVFDGEDVVVLVAVYIVEDRRQGGRLARTGWPGHQHQAARHIGNLAEDLAHAEVFHTQHFRRNGPEYRARTTVLVEGVNPETRHAGYFEGEVGLEEFLEILALLVVHDVVDQCVHLFMVQCRQLDPANITVDPNHRRQASGEMQVRCTLLGAEGPEFSDIHGTP